MHVLYHTIVHFWSNVSDWNEGFKVHQDGGRRGLRFPILLLLEVLSLYEDALEAATALSH